MQQQQQHSGSGAGVRSSSSSYASSSRTDGRNGVSNTTRTANYSTRKGGRDGGLSSSTTSTKTSSYSTRGGGASTCNGVNGVSSTKRTTTTTSSASKEDIDNNGVDVKEGKSFLQDRSKVSGFGDVMGRMAATDAVSSEGGVQTDDQARSLLNRFLGAQVMMTGVESMMAQTNININGNTSANEMQTSSTREETRSTTSATKSSSSNANGSAVDLVQGVDINTEFDEDILRKLLDSCDAYEDRRKVRQRLKTISTNAKSGVSGSGVVSTQSSVKRGGSRDSSSTSSVLRSDHGPKSTTTSQKSSYSTSSYSTSVSKGGSSPFNKFQQLDSQQHTTRRARE